MVISSTERKHTDERAPLSMSRRPSPDHSLPDGHPLGRRRLWAWTACWLVIAGVSGGIALLLFVAMISDAVAARRFPIALLATLVAALLALLPWLLLASREDRADHADGDAGFDDEDDEGPVEAR